MGNYRKGPSNPSLDVPEASKEPVCNPEELEELLTRAETAEKQVETLKLQLAQSDAKISELEAKLSKVKHK